MNKYLKVILLSFLFIFGFVSAASAQIIPLRPTSLRLVFTSDPQSNPRTIKITPTENSIRLTWYSLEKQFQADQTYPTYKIVPKKGAVEFDNFSGKVGFFHPRLWGSGFFRVTELLPLWVDPKYLELSDNHRDAKPFSIEFLNTSKIVMQSSPDEFFEKLGYFQNLYNHFFVDGKVNKKLNLKRSEIDDLESFQAHFFTVKLIAKTNADVIINQQKHSVPTKIIGNDYYHLVVLNDPQNPLVIAMRVFPENAPEAFKIHFQDFKRIFEYQITQVSY